MNKYLFSSALAAMALAAPASIQAQQLPPAVIAVVNIEQIIDGTPTSPACTPCAAANAQIQGQVTQLQQRAQQLQAQLQAEEAQLQAAVNALPQGQQPDAALQARIQTYQSLQQSSNTEIAARRDQIQRNVTYLHQQEGQRLQPALVTIMQQRGATVVIDRAAALEVSPTIDVTAQVLAIMNQNTAPFNVNAPAQAPATAPATRPATTPATTPPRPRPQGR
jgi:Skp family chaperone for outer membrane proteins